MVISAKEKIKWGKKDGEGIKARKEGSKPCGCLRKDILSKRNTKNKGPKVGRCSLCLRKSKKVWLEQNERKGRAVDEVGEMAGTGCLGLPGGTSE